MNEEKKKLQVDEERKLRNITDYVFSCTSRLFEHAELLIYLGKHKDNFRDRKSGNTMTIILSIFDVYSRDAIIIFGHILDEDRRTSSLFTLTDYLKGHKKKKYIARLEKIKKDLNILVKARNTEIAHFNTKLNIYENNRAHVNSIILIDPHHIRKVTKKIETFFWDIKEELSIEGLFFFHKGEPITRSFERLTHKYQAR